MSASDHSSPGILAATAADVSEGTHGNFMAARSRVDAGTRCELHVHREDQVAWMNVGSMELALPGDRRHLRREHVAWIPAGVPHEMGFDEPGELVSLYADPILRPIGDAWNGARTVRVDDLAGAIMRHLVEAEHPPARRRLCWLLLSDLLADASGYDEAMALPRDPRARAVASALLADPGDPRSLRDWAAESGVSAKTLARAFVAETGDTFREWRVRARLHAAVGLLVGGEAVQVVAPAVGYESVSSFIAAFRLRLGMTPAAYAAAARARRDVAR